MSAKATQNLRAVVAKEEDGERTTKVIAFIDLLERKPSTVAVWSLLEGHAVGCIGYIRGLAQIQGREAQEFANLYAAMYSSESEGFQLELVPKSTKAAWEI